MDAGHDERWDALVAQAEAYERARSTDRLAAVAAELIALDPRAPDGHAYRAEVAMLRQRYPAAVRGFREALARDPQDVHVLCRLAVAQRMAGDDDAAEQTIDRALRLAPDDASCWMEKAEILYWIGDHRAAHAALDELFALAPEHPGGLHLRARLDEDTAPRVSERHVRRYLEALEADPDDADVHHDLAQTYLDLGRIDEARRHATEALRLEPTDEDYRETLFETVAARSGLYRVLTAPGRWWGDLAHRMTLISSRREILFYGSGLGSLAMAAFLATYTLHGLTLRPIIRSWQDWSLAGIRPRDVPHASTAALGFPRVRLRLRACLRIVGAVAAWFAIAHAASTDLGVQVAGWIALLVGGVLLLLAPVMALGAHQTWRDEQARAAALVPEEADEDD